MTLVEPPRSVRHPIERRRVDRRVEFARRMLRTQAICNAHQAAVAADPILERNSESHLRSLEQLARHAAREMIFERELALTFAERSLERQLQRPLDELMIEQRNP